MNLFYNWFKKPVEKRESLADLVEGNSVFSTNNLTEKYIMDIPAVAESINYISSTIASLPVKMIKGNVSCDDYRTRLMNLDTGDLLNAFDLKRNMIADLLIYGNAYAYIEKFGNKVTKLAYVHPRDISISENTDPLNRYCKIYINGREVRDFEVMRLVSRTQNGVTGKGLLQTNPLLLQTMYASLTYENSTMRTGAKRGFLTSQYKLDDKSFKDLKKAWQNFCDTENNGVMLLNQGIQYQSASSTATENQLNQSKDANAHALRRILGIDGTTEENFKNCFLPLITQFETTLNQFLLLESEKDTLAFRFDYDELLKSDLKTRYEAYKVALESGVLQVDEVRAMENLESLDLDFIKLSLGDVLYNPKSKEVFTPNTGESTNMQK